MFVINTINLIPIHSRKVLGFYIFRLISQQKNDFTTQRILDSFFDTGWSLSEEASVTCKEAETEKLPGSLLLLNIFCN